MLISAVVCTWNRSELLRQALGRMARLLIPHGLEWELLVVNNNCRDATDEVIVSFSGRLPIRRLFQPRPGLSNARNLAAREARGQYLVWTDDDVLVDENWLNEYCRAFSRWPDAAIFGGPIRPCFEGTPPRWLSRTLPLIANVFITRDLGEDPVPLSLAGNLVPFGANYVVRAAEQARFQYNPELGRRPDNITMLGEETEVLWSILRTGAKGWWVPGAGVRHWIPRSRQTTRYVRQFFYGLGQGDRRLRTDDGEAKLFGRPRWLWRYAFEAEVRYRLRRPLANPEVWIKDLIASSRSWGRLCG